MKRLVPCAVAVAFLLGWGPTVSAETWKGRVSDAMCGAKHADGDHGTKKMTDRQCVEACVKGGNAYAFAVGDKVYKIGNQSFADLKAHAGHEVLLTGDLKGDTITVTKIEMPKADAAKK
jgi:hypothetical protein